MCNTPTNAVEALICLPPLELVVLSEARSVVHHLWSLGCWSYLHPSGGHSSILMRLQRSNPIFNMGVYVMRPAFNLEPKYRATILMREGWTKATGATPAVKGLVWFTDGSKMREGTGAGVYGQSAGRRLSFSLGRYATVFQAEIYAILACVYKIQFQNRLEKYVSICSDSQAALKALQAIRTSPLVHRCQKALNGISNQHAVWLYIISLDMLEYEVMRLPMILQGMAIFWGFLDLSWPWESLDEIYKKGLVVGWSTSIGQDGAVLVTPKDRLKN